MMITITTQDKIIDKAKSKKDGVYRYGGVAYRVRDGKVTHVGNCGEIFECYGYFNVKVHSYKWSINSDEAAQKILKCLK
jgi:hypothetical protein